MAQADAATTDAPLAPARRILLTIGIDKVVEPLTDFPVYLDLTQVDLKTRFDPARMSFKRRVGGTVENLPYELQSFDPTAGRLRAWVLMPSLSPATATLFELQYGDDSVAAAPNPLEVWRNHYKVVFHLEGASAPIVDARQSSPGTPMNLQSNALVEAKLGKGIDFDGNVNGTISFANPLSGNGPSTISVWVSQRNANNKDALVALGNGNGAQARWLYGQFNNKEVGIGLFNDDWVSTSLSIENAGWTLLHWTYENKTSRLFRNGAQINGSPHTHVNPANTAGSNGWLGNSKSTGFDNNAGLNGILDEVRISDIDRSAGWIAAEYANQSNPSMFMTASLPLPIP